MKLRKMFLLQNLLSFSRKSKFGNLDIQISCVIKRLSIKKKHILLNNVGIKQSLLMKFGHFISYYKRKNFIKRSMPFSSTTSIGK